MVYGYRRRYGSRYGSYRRPRRRYNRSYAPSYRRAAPRRVSRKKRATPAKRHVCTCSSELDPGEKFLLGQADPFEPKVIGAKIPDSNTVPSVAVPTTQLSTPNLTSGAGVVDCVAFLPWLTNSIIDATSGVGAWTWPAAYTGAGVGDWNNASAFRTSFELGRPVAHGIRLSSSVAPTSATGFIHIAVAYESFNASATWPFATTIAAMSGYSWYKRVTLASLTQTPLTIVNKYVDETAFRYSGADTGGTESALPMEFHVPFGWGAILIACEGIPSTSPVQAEMILHAEAIPKNSSVIQGNSAAAYSPAIIGASAQMTSNTDFTHTEDNQQEHLATALGNAAVQGLADAGSALLNNAILPGVRSFAYNAAGRAAAVGLAALSRGIGGVNNDPNRLALMR